MNMTKGLVLGLTAGLLSMANVAFADAAGADPVHANYCDFRLYAPSEVPQDTSLLFLERSDLKSLSWTEEDNGWLSWNIEVGDHVLEKWEQVMADSVGMVVSIYCGDDLVATPTIRMPLGQGFKITGMNEDQQRWK